MVLNILIAGTRTFNDYELLRKEVDSFIEEITAPVLPVLIRILSGGASGADALGERYAKQRKHILKVMPADWNKYGRAAGPLRNKQMGDRADACIVFWDGISRGTKNVIDLCKKAKVQCKVIQYNTNL